MENIVNYLADKYTCCVKYWWMSLVLGLIILALGFLMFIYPGISYITMSLLFGVIILVSGVVYIIMSTSKSLKGRGWLLASGIIEVILGLILIMWPVVAAASLPYFLGFWLLFKGFTMIGIGSDMSDIKGSGWGWTIITAILLIICAFLILVYPIVFGIEAVIIWIGISMIVGGISLIAFGIQLKSMHKHIN
ncbi:MAG: DUF308 domain-containing protein [Bacteroidales bacterium]